MTAELSPVGKWNPDLFARYRAAKPGPVRRALLNELLRINAPLVKTLVDQLCGRGEVKRKAVKLGGCQGFRDIPWDDAYQAGCIAFMKAMDRFNPEKGKLPFYLLMKIRYELQVIVGNELRLTRVPRGREEEAVTVTLVGEQRELDELGGSDSAGLLTTGEFTADDLAEWERTGEWPEDLEELRAQRRAQAEAARPVDPRHPVRAFVEDHLEFRPHLRVLRAVVLARFRTATFGLPVPDGVLHQALLGAKARQTRLWVPGEGPRRGYVGVGLRPRTRNDNAANGWNDTAA